MKFYAPIESSLYSAIRSAKRLSGHPIPPATHSYWRELLAESRRLLRHDADLKGSVSLETLIRELESEIAFTEDH